MMNLGGRFIWRKLRVELVELTTEHGLWRKHRLVLGDQRRRSRASERVLDNLVVFRRAEQDADRGPFGRFLHVAVKRLNVEAQFAKVLGLESTDLQLERYEAKESAVKGCRR
jgi:hypothetical protein